ncbi:MAG: hypothetical protein ACM3KM_02535 [Acidobacteriaceae bacterium]
MLDSIRKRIHKYINFKKDEEFVIFVVWVVFTAALLSTVLIKG